MSQVDVLNASYTPLAPTTVPRAISLVQDGDAIVEKADPFNPIRSAELVIATPLVIRMLRFIDVPIVYALAAWSKEGVLERDKYTCAYCGKDYSDNKKKVNVDHIYPRSLGGQNTWENTVCACIDCNSTKDNRTLEEIGWELLFTPEPVYKTYFKSKKARKPRRAK